MGIRIDGNNDLIKAVDDTLTIEGISVNTSGMVTATGGIKVGTAATIHSTGQFNIGVAHTLFANGNATHSGIVTAASFVGSGANLTGITQTTINSNADNRVITGSGSANTLNGETNFTFDGLNINQSMSSDGRGLIQTASGNNYIINSVNANRSSANDLIAMLEARWNSTHVADISFHAGSDTTNKDDGYMSLRTSASAGGISERVRIDSGGDVKVISRGSAASGAPLYVAVTGKSSVTYGGGNDDTACLRVVDNGSTNSYYHGIELRCKRDGDARIYAQDMGSDACDLVFATDNSGLAERLRIASDGKIGINIAGSDNTAPVRNLDIADPSGAILRLISSDDSLGANERLGAIEFFTDDDDGGHVGAAITAIADPSDSFGRRTALLFGTQTTEAANCVERLRITAAGYVGINESTPLFELVVAPTDANESQLQILAGGNGKESNVLYGAPDDGDVGSIKYDHNGDHMKFTVGTSEIFRANSHGICLGGTGSANGLSDYEEGTYTAHFNIEGQGNMSMSGRVGLYCKIGQVVTVMGGGTAASVSGATSGTAIQFSNLPFPVHTTSSGIGHPFPVLMRNMDSTGLGNMSGNQPYSFIGRLFTDSDSGRFEAIKADGAQDPVNAGLAVATNTELHYMFTYITDA